LQDSFLHLHRREPAQARGLSTASPNVVVGVIATGIDCDHEDPNAKMFLHPRVCDSNGRDDDGSRFIGDCDDCYGNA
jgi:hypothetical protein